LVQPEPRPRRRRPAERPAQILDAAGRLFNQRGYDRATTREIAAAAGISEGTLYNYFPSKRALLLALIDKVGESWRQDIEHIHAETLEEAMTQLIAHRMRFVQEHPTTIVTLQQAMLDPEVGRHLDAMVRRGRDDLMDRFRALSASGALRPVEPLVAEEALASMIMGLTIGIELAAAGWHREPLSPEEIARALADVLMNGLRARSEQERNRHDTRDHP
jgi:AcrR family transcriptional regulator